MLEGAAEEGGGEGGDDLGGDLGGDDLGGDDLGGDDLGDDEGGDEDETLLAEPGKRNDMKWRTQNPKPHHTPNDKGKAYIPEKHDDREEAGRRKNMMGKVASELGKNTQRNVFPGMDGFKQHYKGIKENSETNYTEESKVENEVLSNSREIQQIIENLDKREETKNGKI